MSSPPGYTWIIVVGILLLTVVIAAFAVFSQVFRFIYEEVNGRIQRRQPLSSNHQKILKKYCAYYNLLNTADKGRFEKRVQRFIYSKKFTPRVFEEATDEMKVLISATVIQLTFGLPEVYLSHFTRILIYPDSYYSLITRKYHVGEVNPRMGLIILSWKSFVEGYANATDTLNVGIHEIAHAIHFENRIRNEEFDFLDRESLKKLREITLRELPRLRNGETHFFRSYAGTNGYEFFAVALEYFFEKPKEFSATIPDLYATLVQLLNQDPIKLYKLELI